VRSLAGGSALVSHCRAGCFVRSFAGGSAFLPALPCRLLRAFSRGRRPEGTRPPRPRWEGLAAFPDPPAIGRVHCPPPVVMISLCRLAHTPNRCPSCQSHFQRHQHHQSAECDGRVNPGVVCWRRAVRTTRAGAQVAGGEAAFLAGVAWRELLSPRPAGGRGGRQAHPHKQARRQAKGARGAPREGGAGGGKPTRIPKNANRRKALGERPEKEARGAARPPAQASTPPGERRLGFAPRAGARGRQAHPHQSPAQRLHQCLQARDKPLEDAEGAVHRLGRGHVDPRKPQRVQRVERAAGAQELQVALGRARLPR
jgi:hypothetical protein